MSKDPKQTWSIHILENPIDLEPVEELQRLVWPGSETDVVPLHILVTFAHNGGLVIGAYSGPTYSPKTDKNALPIQPGKQLVGFVFGFPGLYFTPDGPRPKHCSHQLGVHPQFRNMGLGFLLKRAQWQMVRHQGIDLITWTYDPLLSRNAHLNISRLGAVCQTYQREVYGEMRDQLNIGLPSDRFQVDWWVNSQRVKRRLSRRPRRSLDLAHFLSAGVQIINPTHLTSQGLSHPFSKDPSEIVSQQDSNLLLLEIPPDFQSLKEMDASLALEWRLHTRYLFENLFERGYLVTDFVYLPATQPRSFYILSYGESTL